MRVCADLGSTMYTSVERQETPHKMQNSYRKSDVRKRQVVVVGAGAAGLMAACAAADGGASVTILEKTE